MGYRPKKRRYRPARGGNKLRRWKENGMARGGEDYKRALDVTEK